MRIYASKVLAEKRHRRRLKVKDPIAGGPGRISKLAEIECNALDFMTEVLLDMDLPSSPQISLGASRGFEDVNTDFEDVSGTIMIYAAFHSLSGFKIRMDFPVPICRGSFYKPSIVIINSKKYVFSQALLDNLVQRAETVTPRVIDNPNPSRQLLHEQTMNEGLFQMPEVDSNFLDLLKDRYSIN